MVDTCADGASVSDVTRRPSTLSFSKSIGECMHELETSSYATPLDQRTVEFVKLQSIEEEVSAFLSHAGEQNMDFLASTQTRYILSGFEKRMQEWERKVPPGVMNRKKIFRSLTAPGY